jgi:SpoVK/Ycf46/Vps4 family AAA+-type ATPase
VTDPEVVRALEAALAAAPDNAPVRLHLARLLLDSPATLPQALEHAQTVLAAQPASTDALDVAAAAARGLGRDDLATGYDRLLRALSGGPAPAVAAASDTDSSDPALAAEVDAFLRNTFADDVDVEEAQITLDDVGGLESVKQQLHRSFIGPLRNPELRAMYGKSLRGGLLLYGPPGCGKTFLARAVAGELGARFYAIGLHEVLDMWLGQSERNLHAAFQVARENAPCVLFFDEVDALGHKRTDLARSAARSVVVQLLTELDGIDDSNDGVFVIGATNAPWDVDAALRRPGRFDRTLLVLPPDRDAREAILRFHLRAKPVAEVDLAKVAARSENYSGADLRLVCESAAEHALDDSLASGVARPIEQRDLEQAAAAVKPSTRAWFEVARNFVTFANAQGEYDDLSAYMKKQRLL